MIAAFTSRQYAPMTNNLKYCQSSQHISPSCVCWCKKLNPTKVLTDRLKSLASRALNKSFIKLGEVPELAERVRLEIVCAPKGYRGFESLPLRNFSVLKRLFLVSCESAKTSKNKRFFVKPHEYRVFRDTIYIVPQNSINFVLDI